jgi:hypothetical protein
MSIGFTTTADEDIERKVFALKDLFVWGGFENRSANAFLYRRLSHEPLIWQCKKMVNVLQTLMNKLIM